MRKHSHRTRIHSQKADQVKCLASLRRTLRNEGEPLHWVDGSATGRQLGNQVQQV